MHELPLHHVREKARLALELRGLVLLVASSAPVLSWTLPVMARGVGQPARLTAATARAAPFVTMIIICCWNWASGASTSAVLMWILATTLISFSTLCWLEMH